MPAKLIVTSGELEGEEFEITEEVLRIGSGTQCEVCVQNGDLETHAATLEFREGKYVLHNRSNDPIDVGGQSLQNRESAVWKSGQEAEFASSLVLKLVTERDPSPSKPAAPTYTIEYDAEEPEADDAAKKKPPGSARRSLNLVVILASVPLIGLMLMNDPSGTDKAPVRRVRFDDVIAKLEANPKDKERGPLSLRNSLQQARAAELRGDKKEARKLYGNIRDTLQLRRASDGKLRDSEDEEVWTYVIGRLQVLQSGESAP